MKLKSWVLSFVVIALPFSAFAEDAASPEATSKVKASDLKPADADRKDIDTEITNAKLRAESGAKSVWSFKSSFIYNGSTVLKPFNADRPNITGTKNTSKDTELAGLMGIKYRINDHDNLLLQTGLTLFRPLGGNLDGQFSLSDPSLTYTHVAKIGGFQSITNFSGAATTAKWETDEKTTSQWYAAETLMYNVGNWDVGAAVDYTINTYSDGAGNPASADDCRAKVPGADCRFNSEFGFYPMLEYAFNDRYSFRTVFRYNTYDTARPSPNKYVALDGTQSLGVGIAVTRDFYLYPNIQFAPQNLRPANTNWGLQTNINL